MFPPPHAECERCRKLIPLLRVKSVFAPEDAPYLFIATHDRRVKETGKNPNGYGAAEYYEVQCEGSMEEVGTSADGSYADTSRDAAWMK